MAQAKARKAWSYKCGERARNRVRAFEDTKRGVIFLEYSERRADGRNSKRRISTGHADRCRAKEQAETLALELRKMVPQRRAPLTLQMLFDNYLREVTPSKSQGKQRHDRATAELFLRCFGGGRFAQSLNRRDWDNFVRERTAGSLRPRGAQRTAQERESAQKNRPVRSQQVRYDLQFLLACLRWATMVIDESGAPALEHMPLRGLALPKEENPRRPVLSEGEYLAMARAASGVSPAFALAFLLAYETGHRAGSIRLLRWADIDFAQRTVRWRAESDKIGLEHTTPLSDEAVTALEGARAAQTDPTQGWVLPGSRDASGPFQRRTLLKWWKACEVLAGVAHVPGSGFHTLRRKFANELKSTNLRDLCGLGGWKSPQTVLTVYQQPELSVMRQALADRTHLRSLAAAQIVDSRNGQQTGA